MRWLTTGLVMAGVALSGCGSSEDTTEVPADSSADFAREAEAVCAEYGARAEDIVLQGLPFIEATREFDALVQQALSEFRTLEAPSDADAKWTQYLGALADQQEVLNRAADAGESGESAEAARLLDEAERPGRLRAETAEALGLNECVSEAVPPGAIQGILG